MWVSQKVLFLHSFFGGDRFTETLARMRALKDLCAPHYPTLAEAAMRYVLSCPELSCVVPGMLNPDQVNMNVAYSDGAAFAADLKAALDALVWPRNFYQQGAVMRQLELLRPGQIATAMAECPRIWLPLGTIEYHSHHLPVGLDGVQAHGLCLDAAEIAGGLVYPPLWWGMGGGRGDDPWTVMMPGPDEIAAILMFTLRRLAAFGVRQAVMFTGHFADQQLAMTARIAGLWNAGGSRLVAIARSVNGNTGPDPCAFQPACALALRQQMAEWLADSVDQITGLAFRSHPN